MTYLDHPFHFDGRGRTADTDYGDHIRDLIELVLFTSPGERVNRPQFGSGLRQLVFAPASEELAAATQLLVQSALQEWLGNLILVDAISVVAEDASLRVKVAYTIRQTQARATAEFTSEAAS